MNIQKSAFGTASVLAAATAALWAGSVIAAPLAPSHPGNSGALFASVMQDPALAEEVDGGAGLAADLQRQVVRYPTTVATGTIIIDTAQTYLYYVLGNGTAIRYGIGVGRDGFTWSGSQAVTRMAEWPDWTPPQEMIARQPYLPRWMAGGKGNPLGARAIYLGSTVYRIHGTNAPRTIGTKVSSGCIRMINADVIDLYRRVTVGTKTIVLPNLGEFARSAAPVRRLAPRTADARTTGIY
jgi:lipoprotein-anchoring transpeptidase ErfK/SrfK